MKVTHLTAQQVGRKLHRLMDTFEESHWAAGLVEGKEAL